MIDLRFDQRFDNIEPFDEKIWLSSPTMHGEELKYMEEAYASNWMSTVGIHIDKIEGQLAEYVGVKYVVALSSGTAALHLAVRLAGERLYGTPQAGIGSLAGHKVFCSDMTFGATVNPVAYEGGEAVFIDSERDTWNMSPEALEYAFRRYRDVKLVVYVHLYGTPGKMRQIRKICDAHGALLIEDAAEALGAVYCGISAGNFGDYAVLSFNGNKIITGSSGGALLTNIEEDARKARKWSTQSREEASWYQHEQIGYNYRMSNVIAGIVRGQLEYLEEHIKQKTRIYQRYKEGLCDLSVEMNPWDVENSKPNFWLSCCLINREAMCESVRSEKEYLFVHVFGKTCPDEILEVLKEFHVEGRPLWKPMHLQPVYRNHLYITIDGEVSTDLFHRGLCLPSDNKMTEEQQNKVIKIVCRCFE